MNARNIVVMCSLLTLLIGCSCLPKPAQSAPPEARPTPVVQGLAAVGLCGTPTGSFTISTRTGLITSIRAFSRDTEATYEFPESFGAGVQEFSIAQIAECDELTVATKIHRKHHDEDDPLSQAPLEITISSNGKTVRSLPVYSERVNYVKLSGKDLNLP